MEVTYEKLMKYERCKHQIKQLKLKTLVTFGGVVVVDRTGGTVLHPSSMDEYIAFCEGAIFVLEHKKNNITNEIKRLADKESRR